VLVFTIVCLAPITEVVSEQAAVI